MVTMTPFEQDMDTAHHFAMGALMVHYDVTDWDVLYALASGFSYYYTRNMSAGILAAWNAYVAELEKGN